MGAVSLNPEWERIDVLGACLANARHGDNVPQELQTRLKDLQSSVQLIREQPPWRQLINDLELTPMDQDVLACVVAPVAEPRLGWMYQELQSGVVSAYPNKALLHELLFMDEFEAQELNSRLQSGAPLIRHGYLEMQNQDSYAPIDLLQKPAKSCLAGSLNLNHHHLEQYISKVQELLMTWFYLNIVCVV